MKKIPRKKLLEYQRRWRASEKGRAYIARYRASAEFKQALRKFQLSPRGIASRKRAYQKVKSSPRRYARFLAACRKYRSSEKGRATQRRWRAKPEVKAKAKLRWHSAPYLAAIVAKVNQHKAAGRCLRCPEKAATGKTLCARHLRYVARKAAEYLGTPEHLKRRHVRFYRPRSAVATPQGVLTWQPG